MTDVYSTATVRTNAWQLSAEAHIVAAREIVQELCVDYGVQPEDVDGTLFDVVALLLESEIDRDTISVAVLRGFRRKAKVTVDSIRKRISATVADLYQGAAKLDTLSIDVRRGDVQTVASNRRVDFSRIMIAMVDDPRVVVIHLAELLVEMREARHFTESEQLTLSNHALSLSTPLANKLGMWRFKWELEDLSFKYTNRSEYDRIVRQLDGRRVEREAYINSFVHELQSLMDKSNINAEVNGRAKHLYGIWRKLNRKGLQFDNLFDVRAVRILVDDIASCYAALGAVHASWTPLTDEFDDYIAVPKPNGYQSLHTAVYGPGNKAVEVQIRTRQMHSDCEYGVAAHWLYKENVKSGAYQEDKIRLLRQLMEWKSEIADTSPDQTVTLDQGTLSNTYVFTPAGKVVELPACATPIDFAYAIHTDVGHRCRGARVNGRMVSLTQVLNTGDWVEIQTVKTGGPSRDWLSSQHKFVVSNRAKACIRRWFKLEEYGRYEVQGRALLDKEFSKHGLTKVNVEKLALNNGYKNSQVFLAAIGMKELKPFHAISTLIEAPPADAEPLKLPRKSAESDAPSLSILGVGNLLTNHASCCGPLPGDDVIGYVTVARGITIHKRSCGNVQRMVEMYPDRLIPVDWEFDRSAKYPVDVEVMAEGHSGLLQEITAAMASLETALVALNTSPIRPHNVSRLTMTIEISSADELSRALARLRSLDHVMRARRLDS